MLQILRLRIVRSATGCHGRRGRVPTAHARQPPNPVQAAWGQPRSSRLGKPQPAPLAAYRHHPPATDTDGVGLLLSTLRASICPRPIDSSRPRSPARRYRPPALTSNLRECRPASRDMSQTLKSPSLVAPHHQDISAETTAHKRTTDGSDIISSRIGVALVA